LILAARMTFPHLLVSSAISLAKSALEPASDVPPSSANRVFILGSATAAFRSGRDTSLAAVRNLTSTSRHAHQFFAATSFITLISRSRSATSFLSRRTSSAGLFTLGLGGWGDSDFFKTTPYTV
jgi:hypothetical protein